MLRAKILLIALNKVQKYLHLETQNYFMAKIEKILAKLRQNPKDIKFTDLAKVCNHYFGEPRQKGTSHLVYKMPWEGDPRVNIQDKNGKAKPYQVKQVLAAIDKLAATKKEKEDG